MKEFRKTKEGLFICEECKNVFKSKFRLATHINKYHILEKYYIKWLKEEAESICENCGGSTKFLSLARGYNITCSKKCRMKLISDKGRQTKLKRYADKNYNNMYKNKLTKLENYGDINYNNREKQKQTKLKRYGDKNYNNITKYKETCLKRYGVENPLQNKQIFEKVQKAAFHRHRFKNTNLTYQGSYELDFLEKFYDKINIENGPSIPYLFEGKNKVYHSDFYIPSLNLVVEIKSIYVLETQGKLITKAKKDYTIIGGFTYVLILEKDYTKFKTLL
jgi:hypothetical protein